MRIHPKREQIIQAIKDGKSYKYIQDTFGCSNVMITYQKRKIGAPIGVKDKSTEKDRKIMNMIRDGYTTVEIMKKLGTHTQRVVKVRNGVKQKENLQWY